MNYSNLLQHKVLGWMRSLKPIWMKNYLICLAIKTVKYSLKTVLIDRWFPVQGEEIQAIAPPMNFKSH
ncbi:MAG: hypothetical protein ACFE0I_22920 [Elainellaceae cyanobacterium]